MRHIFHWRTEIALPRLPPSKQRARRHYQARGLMPILAFLMLWELVARLGIFPSVLFPTFSTVARQWVTLMMRGGLPSDIATTAFQSMGGLALAIAMGVVIGLAMAHVRLVKWFFEPLIAFGFSMPTITLIPVSILWFGVGDESKILLVALTCFFPIALSTEAGGREVNQHLIWSAQALGTTEGRVLWRVILPMALPFIVSGIRIALPVSLIVAFVAEMVGGGGGLGYALVYGYRFLETPTVFAILLTVLVLGFLLDRLLLYAHHCLLPWDEGIAEESAYD